MSKNVRKRSGNASDRRSQRDDGTSQSVSTDRASASAVRPGRLSFVNAVAVAVLATGLLLLAFQPVSSPDLWWQASRGRQVLATGTLTPSIELLALEDRGEANGLGAVLPYGLYLLLGHHGWMLWRLAIVAGGTLAVLRRGIEPQGGSSVEDKLASRNRCAWWPWIIAFPTLVALSPQFDPLPMCFDLIAIGFLAHIMRSFWIAPDDKPHSRKLWLAAGLVLTFVLWANGGAHMVVGLGIVFFNAILAVGSDFTAASETNSASETNGRALAGLGGVVVAGIGGCVNPVGWDAWRQSFLISAPWWGDPLPASSPATWLPLTQNSWDFAIVVFLLLMTLWIVSMVWPQRFPWGNGRKTVPGIDAFNTLAMVPIFFAWTSASTLPLAVAWLALQLTVLVRRSPGQSPRRSDGGTTPAGLVILVVLVGLLLGASRWQRLDAAVGSPPSAGLRWAGLIGSAGWGIDSYLDVRHLQIALEPDSRPVSVSSVGRPSGFEGEGRPTIFADDIRSAGMAAWVSGPVLAGSTNRDQRRPIVQDTPTRAWIGGRLTAHARLWQELREGRQMRYWREDGSPGGWWLALSRRRTALLCFSSQKTGLIRQLEPSIWKPLSLESPVLAYARAGDPLYTGRILDVLSQRETVERGRWAYQPPPSLGSAFDRDRWGLTAQPLRPAAAFRQAEVFLGMNLPIASLRVLEAVRSSGRAEDYGRLRWQGLWRQCQLELADNEKRVIGEPSRFRRLAIDPDARFNGPRDQAPPEPKRPSDQLALCCELYRSVGTLPALRAAERAIDRQPDSASPDLRYAAAWWAVELGLTAEAKQAFARLVEQQSLDPSLKVLVQSAQKRLGWR